MKKIKIFYDYQIMMAQKYGGISRYFYELLSHINETGEAHVDAHCYGNRNAYFKDYFHKIVDKPMRGFGMLNRFVSSKKMKKYDIMHPTYYHPYVLDCKYNKLVITVYDMIHERFAELFAPDDATVENKKKLIYGADHIIAISENTKRDILELYPDISPDKITVIYIGTNMMPKAENVKLDLPERFILFVGNRGLYKNFIPFFRSVKPLLLSDPSLHLVCLGGGAFNEEERELCADVADRVIQFNAGDAELSYAYSKALCFVFPSRYEGFGIPTLEAFGCDCPVVLSRTSSMPEVGGDAAVYFDPENEDDMREKIAEVVSNEGLRAQMIEKGRVQLSKFGWDKIARDTLECYKKVLGIGKEQA